MTKVPLASLKDDVSGYVKRSARDEVLITRRGKPTAIPIEYAHGNDWLDYRLEHDERFVQRIAQSREQVLNGKFTRLEDLSEE